MWYFQKILMINRFLSAQKSTFKLLNWSKNNTSIILNAFMLKIRSAYTNEPMLWKLSLIKGGRGHFHAWVKKILYRVYLAVKLRLRFFNEQVFHWNICILGVPATEWPRLTSKWHQVTYRDLKYNFSTNSTLGH